MGNTEVKKTEVKKEVVFKDIALNLAKKAESDKLENLKKRSFKRIETVNKQYDETKPFIMGVDKELGLNSVSFIEGIKSENPTAYFLMQNGLIRNAKRVKKLFSIED